MEIITPGDPNDKGGRQGVEAQQYVPASTPLVYPISYGNEADASANAQTVIITDPLNPSLVDVSTFSFGPISVAGQTLFPPQGTAYSTTVDLRPGTNLLVGLNASFDPSTGIATWTLTSIDPSTGLPTTNPVAGFLPPGANGSVFLTVMPKQNVASGTQIKNQATIVFVPNPPMMTPTWLNTIDNAAPMSHVIALPNSESAASFNVSWIGTDADSGITDYTIYASYNGGAFTPWLTNTTATSATFNGLTGDTYSFYSVARDLVGNVEAAKTAAEATTTVVIPVAPILRISTITPDYGGIAAFVTISGSNLGTSEGNGYVQVNGAKSQVIAWSDTAITVRVPYNGTHGAGSVVVTANGAPSNAVPFTLYAFPTVTNVSATTGMPGTALAITGTNLLDGGGKASATFNGTPATILSDSTTSIQVRVPAAATSGKLDIEVNGVPLIALQDFVVTPSVPNIVGISPNYGAIAADITISGNFDPAPGNGYVTVGGGVSQITSWSSSRITIRAPYDGSTGNVIVRQDGKTSNGVPFTLYPFPTITNVSASSGGPGTAVSITGTNLLDGGGNARVTFNGKPATITSDTTTRIQVNVPVGATSGRVIMEVNNVALYALQNFEVE